MDTYVDHIMATGLRCIPHPEDILAILQLVTSELVSLLRM